MCVGRVGRILKPPLGLKFQKNLVYIESLGNDFHDLHHGDI